MPRQPTDATQTGTSTPIAFLPCDAANDGAPGLEVIDQIERHRYSLSTDRALPPAPPHASPDRFHFPVDAAIAIRATTITLPTVVPVCLRTATGDALAEIDQFGRESLPHEAYSIEVNAPIKLYLRVESAVTVSSTAFETTIEFDGPTDIIVGARSAHEQPAGTITTTSDPIDMMAAVSTFGSALKTTSCERSYPSLRGHPPTIELGDELSIPDGISPPETGVTIELPPTLESVYVAAPLAYYLGATLVPGDRPVIRTETGFEHALNSRRGFEDEVERVLKQVFFLDCLTRTEGYYPVELHERIEIEEVVDLDFETLYECSLAEQLDTYLQVPYEVLQPSLPEWKLTSHVECTPASIETLPFVVNDLAVVHTPIAHEVAANEVQRAAVDEFFRDTDFTRSTTEGTGGLQSFMQPEPTDTLEDAWIGSDTPVGASKATVEAFRNRLGRTPSTDEISITVVCNDQEMDAERSAVDEVYGSREELPFDVTIEQQLTTAELREVLTQRCDFLHYIGHIDATGFQCVDGMLDAATLETVGADAFFLNACQSYEQGLRLLERGAIGGVVTLSDVINSGAITIGRVMARLLNSGFPLQAALSIAREQSIVGGQYTVVGDGGLSVTQAESGTPVLCEVVSQDRGFVVSMRSFVTSNGGMGSLFVPYVDEAGTYFLNSGRIQEFELTEDQLAALLSLEDVPVKMDGELTWSCDLNLEMLSTTVR